MSLIYGSNNPSKMRRRKERAAKREQRKIKKFAKWAELDVNKPEEKEQATAGYKAWAGKEE